MQDPLRKGNWMRDGLGTQSPLGGFTNAKELQQLPSEMQKIALAANTLIRGNFNKDLWPDLAMANALAPRHRGTQVFLASITAGSMAEDGAAGKKFLMALTNMLAPGMLANESQQRYDKRKAGRFGKGSDSKDEVADE